MSSIKKNYLYNVVYEVLLIALPLITSPYVSRVLGPETIGNYTKIFTISNYFLLFARLGIVNYGSRSIAAAQDQNARNRVFSNCISAQVLLTSVILILYFSYLSVFSLADRLTVIVSLYLVASLFDINWFFFGIEKFKITVTRNILIKLASTVLIFICVKNESDIWKYALLLGLSNLIGQMAVWPYVGKYVHFVRPDPREVVRQFKPLFILFIPQIAVSLYKMMDKIMLGTMCGDVELAYYEYASMIVGLPLGFITSLGSVMLPRASALISQGNKEKNLEYSRLSILFVTALSSAMAFGLSGVAPVFIPFYFGEDFAGAARLVPGLAATLIFISWANVIRTQHLLPLKKDREYIISLFSGATINIVINFLLIPSYHAVGAVIGTIAAEITVCVIQTYMVRQQMQIAEMIKVCIPFPIIGFLMFGVVRGIQTFSFIPPFLLILLQIFTGAFVYIIMVYVYIKKWLHMDVRSLFRK